MIVLFIYLLLYYAIHGVARSGEMMKRMHTVRVPPETSTADYARR